RRDEQLALEACGAGISLSRRLLDDDRPAEGVDLCRDAELLPSILVAIFLPGEGGRRRQERMRAEVLRLRDKRLLVGISVGQKGAVRGDDQGVAVPPIRI